MNSYAHFIVRWALEENWTINGSYYLCTASVQSARKIIVTARRCSGTGPVDLSLVCSKNGIV